MQKLLFKITYSYLETDFNVPFLLARDSFKYNCNILSNEIWVIFNQLHNENPEDLKHENTNLLMRLLAKLTMTHFDKVAFVDKEIK